MANYPCWRVRDRISKTTRTTHVRTDKISAGNPARIGKSTETITGTAAILVTPSRPVWQSGRVWSWDRRSRRLLLTQGLACPPARHYDNGISTITVVEPGILVAIKGAV